MAGGVAKLPPHSARDREKGCLGLEKALVVLFGVRMDFYARQRRSDHHFSNSRLSVFLI